MFVKKYLLIDQSIKKIVESSQSISKINRSVFISKVIEDYSHSMMPYSMRIIRYLRYVLLCLLILLSSYSLYITLTSPYFVALSEYSKNCTIMKQADCPTEFDSEKWSVTDAKHRLEGHLVWNFYTNILTIILFCTYFSYSCSIIYRLYRGGDISFSS